MTDEDIVNRVAVLWGVKPAKCNKPAPWQGTYKITTRGERAIAFMREMYPYLGQRRRAQIDRAIASAQSLAVK